VAALGPLDPGLGAGQRELSDVNPRLEQMLRALSEEGVLDLLLLVVVATSGGLVILLRAEEEVDLALGLEVNHERAEAVTALHLALAEESDGLAQTAEARAHGGVVGGHGHGVGAAPLEELLHRALVALPRSAVVIGDLIPHLVLGGGRGGRAGRDGDGGDRRVDGDGEGSHWRGGRGGLGPWVLHGRQAESSVGFRLGLPGGGGDWRLDTEAEWCRRRCLRARGLRSLFSVVPSSLLLHPSFSFYPFSLKVHFTLPPFK
jgi:hypothetical protein